MVIFGIKGIIKMVHLNHIINRIKEINPNIKFLGSFDENNRRTGYWEEYHDNGDVYSKGNYLNGKRDGYWEEYWSNGNLSSKGNYKNNKSHGYWDFYHFNGDLMCIWNYKNGRINGFK
jgi:antitoxin component YwqK of YwqJK toxin-antitoxin module